MLASLEVVMVVFRRQVFLGASFVGLLLSIPLAPLTAQDPADRPFFDSLLVDFAKASNGGQVPGLDRCAARTGSTGRLCEGLIGARRAEYNPSIGDINKSRDLLERTVLEQPKWPIAWYALAMARVQATRSNAVSREGPLQPLGMSNELGAGLALIRAISLDSSFTPAIEALAVIPTPREGPGKYTERIQSLRGLRDRLSGIGKYATGLMEFELGNADSSITWFRDALRDPKIDRGMVRLALARALYKTGQASDGRAVLLAGANDTSAASRLAYRQFLSFVATPAELASWDSLKVGSHGQWFTSFWSTRDVTEGLSEGARLAEHFRRFEFAMKNYQLKEVQQGQQVVSAQARRVDPARDELSFRYFNDLRDKIQAQAADTLQATGMMLTAALEKGTYQAPFRSFRALRDKLDDRGVVYVRYGAPDKKEEVPDDGGAALWEYNLNDGPIFIAFRSEEFTGNAGPTRMVPHLYDLPIIARNKFCVMRPSLCGVEDQAARDQATAAGGSLTGTRAVGGGTSQLGETGKDVAIIRREAEEGIRSITRATTTEAFRRDFAKPLLPSVQVLPLDRLVSGAPRIVVSFAIPGNQLGYTTPPEANGRAVYSVRIQSAMLRGYDGKRIESDTIRTWANAKPLADGEFLSGLVEIPVQPGQYAGSIIFSQDEGQGAIVRLNGITVPDEKAVLTAGALVLGKAGGGVEWNSGTSRVPLNPFNSFKKGSEANLYVQLRGLTPGQSYDLSFEFFKGESTGKADLALAFKENPTADREEFTKILAFPALDAGTYRVVMTIKGNGQEASTSGSLTIVK